MVKEAKLHRAYDVDVSENGTTLSVKSRRLVAMRFAFLLTLIAVLPVLFCLMGAGDGGALPLAGILLFLAFVWFLATRKKRVNITINGEGIIAKNKLYRHADIESVGVTNIQPGLQDNNIIGPNSPVFAHVSYYIYLTHGARRVQIIKGLEETESEGVYGEMRRILAQYGSDYSQGSAYRTFA
jgi:hypothetical protein